MLGLYICQCCPAANVFVTNTLKQIIIIFSERERETDRQTEEEEEEEEEEVLF